MTLAARSARRDRAGDLFPPLAYAPEEHLFLLADESLGFGFRCRPAAGTDGVANGINVLLNLDWPAGTCLQFCLWASPDLEAVLAGYQALRSHCQAATRQAHVAQRVAFIRGGTHQPLEPRSGLRARHLQLVMTAKLPLAGAEPTAAELSRAGELRTAAAPCLQTAGLSPGVLDPEGWLRVMGSLLNWDADASWQTLKIPLYDPAKLLCDQVLDFDTDLRVDSQGLWAGSQRVTLLSVKQVPERVVMGSALAYLGEAGGQRGVRDNVLISATVYLGDADKARSRLEQSRHYVTHQAYGPLLKFVPKLGHRKHAYDVLFGALEDGDRVVQLYLSLALLTPDADAATTATANLRAYYRELGFQLVADQFICLPAFLNSLPFGADRVALPDLRRLRTLAGRQAAPLLPVFGDWAGTGTPALLLVSRNGQVMPVSVFDSGSNFNLVIAAGSGKGKSFLTNEMIDSYLGMGARIWVIDVGRSYEKLAKSLGGEFLAFTPDAVMCLNPFPLVGNYDEEADMLAGLLTAMGAPQQGLSDLQTAELKRVLRQVWDEHGPGTTFDAVAAALLAETDSRVADLGKQLYSFTNAGEYGRYFNGPNTVRFNADFVVLELEELKGRKHLQQIVLLQLIYQIQQAMYQRADERSRPKLVLIDEAWDLLTAGNIAKFIENGYRRFRKYGGAAVTITQSVNDLYNTPGGVAIVENSANMYLLGQKAETIDGLREAKRLPLGPGGYELLKSVHTIPGAYSEILLITEAGAGIGRLIVEPYKRLLYSTKADEVAAIAALEAQGFSQHEAILKLLEQGYGA